MTRRTLLNLIVIPFAILALVVLASGASEKRPTSGGYSFRSPDYSLRDKPQWISPRTPALSMPSPEQAVVFGWPICWRFSHWSGSSNTDCAGQELHDDLVRFMVTEPNRRKVWVKYFDVPIDPQCYPVVVMTYRVMGTKEGSGGYVLYLDDGSGPGRGGMIPFRQKDLVADGAVRTVTCYLLDMEPIGDMVGLAVGVHCGEEGGAVFDLIDLRFESMLKEPLPVAEGEAFTVRVKDAEGRPVMNATVTVDAERRNWARSVSTDKTGLAQVTPYTTKSRRHMIRVEAPDMLAEEFCQVRAGEKPIAVVLVSACEFGGTVVDPEGLPLPDAAVRLRVDSGRLGQARVRRDAVVLTDEYGVWRTPQLPAEADRISAAVAHPHYRSRFVGNQSVSVEELREGRAKLNVLPGCKMMWGYTVDEEGARVTGACVSASKAKSRTTAVDTDVFELPVSLGGDTLLVQCDGYLSLVRQLTAEEVEKGELGPIVLKAGHVLCVHVQNPEGEPVSRAVVTIRDPALYGASLVSLRTDAQGSAVWNSAPAAPVEVEATCRGFGRGKIIASPGDEPVRIILTPQPDRTSDSLLRAAGE